MKKILFGSAAAICTVVGLSSFKASQKFNNNIYWFCVDKNNVTQGNRINNSDATFLIQSTSIPDGCFCPPPVVNLYYCLVGFDASQITHNGSGATILKTSIGIPQSPIVTAILRTDIFN